MSAITVQIGQAGLVGVSPCEIRIQTPNTVAEVTTPGFLDSTRSETIQYHNEQMALVTTVLAGVPTCGWYNVSVNPTTKSVTLTAI